MKPTRGLSASWLSSLPPERRTALVSLAALLVLLGSLVVYQRFTEERAPAEEIGGATNPGASGQPATGATPGTNTNPELGLISDPAETQVALAPPKQLRHPLTGKPRELQSYGYAFSDTYGDFRLHPWINYEAKQGDAVLAAATGKVVSIEDDPAVGRMLMLEHPGGLTTRYAGLGKVSVELNSTVESGHPIGQVGDPGMAKLKLGTQLGFSVWLNDEPVNPALYLSTKN